MDEKDEIIIKQKEIIRQCEQDLQMKNEIIKQEESKRNLSSEENRKSTEKYEEILLDISTKYENQIKSSQTLNQEVLENLKIFSKNLKARIENY